MSISAGDIDIGSWGIGKLPEVGSLNPSQDINTGSQGGTNWISGFGDILTGLAGAFTNGINIFKSVSGQYAAASAIAKESFNPPATVVNIPASNSLLSKDNLIKIAIVAGVGVLALMLIRKR